MSGFGLRRLGGSMNTLQLSLESCWFAVAFKVVVWSVTWSMTRAKCLQGLQDRCVGKEMSTAPVLSPGLCSLVEKMPCQTTLGTLPPFPLSGLLCSWLSVKHLRPCTGICHTLPSACVLTRMVSSSCSCSWSWKGYPAAWSVRQLDVSPGSLAYARSAGVP